MDGGAVYGSPGILLLKVLALLNVILNQSLWKISRDYAANITELLES